MPRRAAVCDAAGCASPGVFNATGCAATKVCGAARELGEAGLAAEEDDAARAWVPFAACTPPSQPHRPLSVLMPHANAYELAHLHTPGLASIGR